ncbi:hypothetical protein [Streptomyces sp. NPDC093589]|uniref:hypothetical protein n=1 Tax=Streptomyces sp. NPDC093589 TaxID=3366043 RepID=UPI003800AE55
MPAFARLLQRRLGAPAAGPAARVVGAGVWLFALLCQHAGGRVLSYGAAVASVQGPHVPLRRRLAQLAVFTALAAGLGLLLVVADAAGERVVAGLGVRGWPVGVAGGAAAALVLAPLVWAVVGLARTSGNGAWAVTAARRARGRGAGGIWWSVGDLAAAEGDPVSAGRLAHHALRYADAHGVGLVAAARTPELARAYRCRGFTADPDHPPALVRPPRRREQ